MDTRLNHRAALVRTAELHREAAVHRLAQHATRRQKPLFWRWLSGLGHHRTRTETPAPVAVAQPATPKPN